MENHIASSGSSLSLHFVTDIWRMLQTWTNTVTQIFIKRELYRMSLCKSVVAMQILLTAKHPVTWLRCVQHLFNRIIAHCFNWKMTVTMKPTTSYSTMYKEILAISLCFYRYVLQLKKTVSEHTVYAWRMETLTDWYCRHKYRVSRILTVDAWYGAAVELLAIITRNSQASELKGMHANTFTHHLSPQITVTSTIFAHWDEDWESRW